MSFWMWLHWISYPLTRVHVSFLLWTSWDNYIQIFIFEISTPCPRYQALLVYHYKIQTPQSCNGTRIVAELEYTSSPHPSSSSTMIGRNCGGQFGLILCVAGYITIGRSVHWLFDWSQVATKHNDFKLPVSAHFSMERKFRKTAELGKTAITSSTLTNRGFFQTCIL